MQYCEGALSQPLSELPNLTTEEVLAAMSEIDGYDRLTFVVQKFDQSHLNALVSMTNRN